MIVSGNTDTLKGPVKRGVSVSLTSLIFGFPMSFYMCVLDLELPV